MKTLVHFDALGDVPEGAEVENYAMSYGVDAWLDPAQVREKFGPTRPTAAKGIGINPKRAK